MSKINKLIIKDEEYNFYPIDHSSGGVEYGTSTENEYGHCKTHSVISGGTNMPGIVCNAKSGYDIWGQIKILKTTISNNTGTQNIMIKIPKNNLILLGLRVGNENIYDRIISVDILTNDNNDFYFLCHFNDSVISYKDKNCILFYKEV